MILDRLDIVNFKNIAEAGLSFSPGVNCLLGSNGMGKSNLLEAIHFLSFVRPVQPMPETALIRHGADMLLVKGSYTFPEMPHSAPDKIACGIVRGKGKTLKLNGKEYPRISQHIGRFPLVTVTPRDVRLVEESGDERRRLMDTVIAQSDSAYLANLIAYNRALDSRNRMLRSGVKDALLYESVENAMQTASGAVFAARRDWTAAIAPLFAEYYSRISGDAEKASLAYRSVLADACLPDILAATRQKDVALGYTSKGVHRDDLEMQLDGYSARRLGSQGQVKTYTIALRLAIFDFLRESSGKTPLLLLDDIFDKLDAARVGRIMEVVSTSENFGQIFITDTNRKHLDEIVEAMQGERLLLEVADGSFTSLTA